MWLAIPPRTPLRIIAEDARLFHGVGEGSDTRVKVTIGSLEYFKATMITVHAVRWCADVDANSAGRPRAMR